MVGVTIKNLSRPSGYLKLQISYFSTKKIEPKVGFRGKKIICKRSGAIRHIIFMREVLVDDMKHIGAIGVAFGGFCGTFFGFLLVFGIWARGKLTHL